VQFTLCTRQSNCIPTQISHSSYIGMNDMFFFSFLNPVFSVSSAPGNCLEVECTCILILFCGLECVGQSFAYLAHFVFLRDVWIRTQRAAVASRRLTHLSQRYFIQKKQFVKSKKTVSERHSWACNFSLLPLCLLCAHSLSPISYYLAKVDRLLSALVNFFF
jgi:hypothetical protein